MTKSYLITYNTDTHKKKIWVGSAKERNDVLRILKARGMKDGYSDVKWREIVVAKKKK